MPSSQSVPRPKQWRWPNCSANTTLEVSRSSRGIQTLRGLVTEFDLLKAVEQGRIFVRSRWRDHDSDVVTTTEGHAADEPDPSPPERHLIRVPVVKDRRLIIGMLARCDLRLRQSAGRLLAVIFVRMTKDAGACTQTSHDPWHDRARRHDRSHERISSGRCLMSRPGNRIRNDPAAFQTTHRSRSFALFRQNRIHQSAVATGDEGGRMTCSKSMDGVCMAASVLGVGTRRVMTGAQPDT